MKESQRLAKEINFIEQQLKHAPEGKLVLCFDGKKNYKWFQSQGQGQNYEKKYIKKEDRKLAEQLACKNYLTLRLEELMKEKRAADAYLALYPKGESKANLLLSESSEYQKLTSSYFTPLKQELNNWVREPYEKKKTYAENLIHKTNTGEFVRSKSEVLIHTFLTMNKIPFRYECALKLGNMTVYPDFTIRHPKTGEFYYYEHFGCMDDLEYVKKTNRKLGLYMENEIIPSINFITTFETKKHPLTMDEIRNAIDRYILQ